MPVFSCIIGGTFSKVSTYHEFLFMKSDIKITTESFLSIMKDDTLIALVHMDMASRKKVFYAVSEMGMAEIESILKVMSGNTIVAPLDVPKNGTSNKDSTIA